MKSLSLPSRVISTSPNGVFNHTLAEWRLMDRRTKLIPLKRNDDCGDASDEIGCNKHNGKTCESHGDNGGCKHFFTDISDGYYCHCRDGFQPDPQNPLDCIDVDECKGNNTCIQLCLNTKGSYLCRSTDNYENKVVVGAMTGKDCRAKGEPAEVRLGKLSSPIIARRV
ncbi:unnamed protein product, partial [Mesorhabditis belari]|uniref:EGF-like calcium-binding domain-containing protein n=1 Tax=Mesorhabditis belari TaxID=2138241 RepID=A0AAF3FLP0_9BILA